MKKQTKFFMAGTDDELQFGDTIEVDLTKEAGKNHVKHHHIECKFHPMLVDILLEKGIIEEREVEEEMLDLADDDIDLDEGYLNFEPVVKQKHLNGY